MTPTQRSLAWLRRAGYICAIVEHWNPFARIRQDLFGFADLIAFKTHMPILLVQTTGDGHLQDRVKKILANPIAKAWIESGHEIRVESWGKRGDRGKQKRWEVQQEWIELSQFD